MNHTIIPVTYASSAGTVAIRRYFKNVRSLMRVMAIIPGAEPIIRSDPPTPTVKANKVQREEMFVFTISIAAAVRGILSKIAENSPINIFPDIIRCVDG